MVKIENEVKLTFDDVLLVPNYSEIKSRETININQLFLGYKLGVPILSSNMDLVTGARMAVAMWNAGGLGILHRFYPSYETEQIDIFSLISSKVPVAFSVGIRDKDATLWKIGYVNNNAIKYIVTIDVAHGHHEQVGDMIYTIKSKFPNATIIAGNVATWAGYSYLSQAGADAVKVGIGPGSACTTRVVTGFGYPQFSAILDISSQRDKNSPPIISDGGIKCSGDIVKALAAGADVVMIGNLLAGTQETPGEVFETIDGHRFRQYRGQSIFGANGERYVKEGVSGFVEEKGPVQNVINSLAGGIRSGLSYVGANNLSELREKAQFIRVSPHTIHESNHRLKESL